MNHVFRIIFTVGACILVSTPGNAQSQWRLRYPLPTSEPLYAATYGKGLFVAVGPHNTVLTSADGVSWTSRLPQSPLLLSDVAFGNGRFVAIAPVWQENTQVLTKTQVLTSTNGTTWSETAPANGLGLERLMFAEDVFVGIGSSLDPKGAVPVIVTSADGATWFERWRREATGPQFFDGSWDRWVGLAAVGNGTVVVSTTNPAVFVVSTNRVNWTEIPSGVAANSSRPLLAFGAGTFVALSLTYGADQNRVLQETVSADGLRWEPVVVDSGQRWTAGPLMFGFANGQFLYLLENRPQGIAAVTSADGRTWEEHALNGVGSFPWGALVYGHGNYVLVGGDGFSLLLARREMGEPPRLYSSTDGLSWTKRLGDQVSSALVAGGNGVLALGTSWTGEGTTVRRSETGVTWSEAKAEGLSGLDVLSLAYGNGLYVAVGGGGIFTSVEGTRWSLQPGAGADWTQVRYSAGKFVALGRHQNGWRLGISSDGLVWSTQVLDKLGDAWPLDVVTSGQSVAVIAQDVLGNGVILASADLANWRRTDLKARQPFATAYGNGVYVALAQVDAYRRTDPPFAVLTSSDGLTWTEHSSILAYRAGLVFGNGQFYAMGSVPRERSFTRRGTAWNGRRTRPAFTPGFPTFPLARQACSESERGEQFCRPPGISRWRCWTEPMTEACIYCSAERPVKTSPFKRPAAFGPLIGKRSQPIHSRPPH